MSKKANGNTYDPTMVITHRLMIDSYPIYSRSTDLMVIPSTNSYRSCLISTLTREFCIIKSNSACSDVSRSTSFVNIFKVPSTLLNNADDLNLT